MKTERVLFLALVLMGTFCSFHAAAMEDVTFVRQEQGAGSIQGPVIPGYLQTDRDRRKER
ncbi:hypothetical protein [Dialister succinatiphilus]|uniref:hypothetical protein n=1 Tax=Dialister succinatiphilus TaxID=487173 RepID=UPI004029A5F7